MQDPRELPICQLRNLIRYSNWNMSGISLKNSIDKRISEMRELNGVPDTILVNTDRCMREIKLGKGVVVIKRNDVLCSEVFILDSRKDVRDKCQCWLFNLKCHHTPSPGGE